jgi:hypothetical protein
MATRDWDKRSVTDAGISGRAPTADAVWKTVLRDRKRRAEFS